VRVADCFVRARACRRIVVPRAGGRRVDFGRSFGRERVGRSVRRIGKGRRRWVGGWRMG